MNGWKIFYSISMVIAFLSAILVLLSGYTIPNLLLALFFILSGILILINLIREGLSKPNNVSVIIVFIISFLVLLYTLIVALQRNYRFWGGESFNSVGMFWFFIVSPIFAIILFAVNIVLIIYIIKGREEKYLSKY